MRISIRASAAVALIALVAFAQTANAESVSTSIGTPTAEPLGLQLPGAVTGGATVTSPTTATLTGTVDPNGQTTSAYFEYGTGNVLNLTSPLTSVGNGVDPANVATDAVGLQPGTTYSYRIAGDTVGATTTGSTQTFTTPAASGSGTPASAVKARSRKTVCRVPRLRGKTVKAAKRAIRRAHCKLGKVKRQKAKSVKRGRVVSSSPKAGTKRAKGSKVKLTVRR